MAYFYCHIDTITRSEGRSALNCAAYRGCTKLESEYTGEVYDYTRKQYYVDGGIALPEGADPSWRDRQCLWNAVESAETSRMAKLAKDVMVVLPCELSEREQIAVCRRISMDIAAKGYAVEYDIHCPPIRDDFGRPIDKDGHPTTDKEKMQYNPHCHIMIPMRSIDKTGHFTVKTQGAYVCKHRDTGEIKVFTGQELREAGDAWQKQYQYLMQDGSKAWLTRSEGDSMGLERSSRFPRKQKYGKASDDYEYIQSDDFIRDVKQIAEKEINRGLEKAGCADRVDCRSYAERGMTDMVSEKHMGYSATQIERRARRMAAEGRPESEIVRSHVAMLNKEIRKHNQRMTAYKRREETAAQLETDAEKQSAMLAAIRSQWISERAHGLYLKSLVSPMDAEIERLEERIKAYKESTDAVRSSISSLAEKKQDLIAEIRKCGAFDHLRKKELRELLIDTDDSIEQAERILRTADDDYGYGSDRTIETEEKDLSQMMQERARLEKEIAVSKSAEMGYKDRYKEQRKLVPVVIREQVRRLERSYTYRASQSAGVSLVGELISIAADAIVEEIREMQEAVRWEERQM